MITKVAHAENLEKELVKDINDKIAVLESQSVVKVVEIEQKSQLFKIQQELAAQRAKVARYDSMIKQ